MQKKIIVEQFNLDKALIGDKVITRDGHEASDLAYFKNAMSVYKVRATVKGIVMAFTVDGEVFKGCEEGLDLFMAPAKRCAFVRRSHLNSVSNCRDKNSEGDLVYVEWEE